jgi:transcriptional regulator with XRE-family HTH domain
VKALRGSLGLTQQQAADKAGMSTRQQWNDIESGRQSPSLDTLGKIARALGVDAADLLVKGKAKGK